MKIIIKTPGTPDPNIKNRKVVEVENILKAAQFFADEHISFDIATDRENAFSTAYTAKKFDVNLIMDGEIINFRNKNIKNLDKIIAHCKLAHGQKEVRSSAKMLTEELIGLVPSRMCMEDALAIISDTISGKTGKLTAIEFEAKIKERDAAFIAHVSISDDADVERSNLAYGPELVQFILDNPVAIHILNGDMGTGKTKNVMLPVFENLCTNGSVPIYSAPRRSLAAATLSDDRHYHSCRNAQNIAPGVVGVVNSLFDGRFDELLGRSSAILIDEFELHESHITSRAVGRKGTLQERGSLVSAVYKHIKEARYVILADAMFSQFSVERLSKLTGKKIYVHRGTAEKRERDVTLCAENDNVTAALEAIYGGNKVAVFSDAPHNSDRSKFNEIYNTINAATSTLKIDGASAKEGVKDFFGRINEKVKAHEAAVISPVISSGVSLTGHFSHVHFLGHETIDPLQLAQTLMRVRDSSSTSISINSNPRKHPTSKGMLLSNELQKELPAHRLTDKELRKYEENKSAELIIERMSYENQLMSDYANASIVILQHLGFNIKRQKKSVGETLGKIEMKAGREMEKANRAAAIKSAPKLSKSEIGRINNKEVTTDADKYTIAANKISSFYRVEINKITDQLIEFDNHGKGRKLVNNHKALLTETSDQDRAEKVTHNRFVRRVAELINIEEGSYTASQAQQLYQFITSGFIEIGDRPISARSILVMLFPDVSVGKQPGALARNILAQGFGFGVKPGKRIRTDTGRERTYNIVHTDKSRAAHRYAMK